jgi:UPF0042 nucleotide-binding protein
MAKGAPATRAKAPRVKPGPRLSATRQGARRFVVVTGLSGSGKSHAIRALEDLGYFCVDNLPTLLIPALADLAVEADSGLDKVAIVVDVREGGLLKDFPQIYRALSSRPRLHPTLIFLEANEAALVRRFSETRRPHPMARDRSVPEGIAEERRLLDELRSMADLIVDTSNLTVHELRDIFMGMSRDGAGRAEMVVNLLSFGYKHGIPDNADLMFDVRCLPNPHFVDTLRGLTGRDAPVIQFMHRHAAPKEFLARLTSFLRFALPHYVAEGKTYLTVAIGCTGGQHRSVWMAESLKNTLAHVKGVKVRVRHRDS